MSNSFSSLGLSDELTKTLKRLGMTEPFPVQAEAIPPALAGKDIKGKAPTGSGKTLAFGLPMLARVARAERNRPRALVLAPTRELAEQIRRDLAPLAETAGRRMAAVYGGVGYGPQLKALRSGVDILVATPGRLEDLLQRRDLTLGDVEIVVVDEADRMADMGFMPAVSRILDFTNRKRQTFLFSATLDGDVAVLSRKYQTNPVTVEAESVTTDAGDVEHHFWKVSKDDRPVQTARLIESSGRSIIFTRTRHGADRLVKQLEREQIKAASLHGGRSQSQRTKALQAFSGGRTQALVATDVAARGIHVEAVDAVVHYDMANGHKDYVHRSGRTARAGATGTVVTLVMPGQEGEIRKLQRELGLEQRIETPNLSRLQTPADRRVEPAKTVRTDRTVRPEKPNGSKRPAEVSGASLYVGNLPWKTTDDQLAAMFSAHGPVETATISTQRNSGRSKGFGFVEMPESHHAGAIRALDGFKYEGRVLSVRPAW
jgi:superfamily II DNA/RNA helicase